ncbi:nitroreductase family deazaflavin-dependent oxidoreductase [Intrasporangium flavum]|uniref:nitroreductase family deazaflavin-dependent oxidoreductase n=1 Tax=Intrasporangium flavum TaxID=1428657 RepID=UPI00096E1A0E|nr:nitroreductase family deazaflavin-dependent oxidoreductase [Intrasporangium flavum]
MPEPPAGVRTFNRFAVRAAGHRLFPLWAVLRHRGRRSGTEFAVPVAVLTTPDAFVIALPWGRGTDWVRNTRAAGGCSIRWKGREWACTDPTFVGKDVALAAAGPVLRRVLTRQDPAGGFLHLTRRPA